jgi:signal transduction histidine kinase
MKVGLTAAAVPCLIALLTWLSLRAIDPGAERFDRALNEIDRFGVLEAGLQRDVLTTRAAILRNYDPLVRESDGLDHSLVRLHDMALDSSDAEVALDRLTVTKARQEDLVEHFKSNNALLQNSLAYFAQLSLQMGAPRSNGPLAPAVSALAAAMLRLALDTSATNADEVQGQLDELAKEPLASGDAEVIPALLAHGRLLHKLLPATDGLLRALDALPLKHDQEALRRIIVRRQLASRNTARRFRAWLYITSLVLVGLLVYVGLQLHARARGLRRRAAFEHVIAGVSMSFVGAWEQDLGSIIRQGLEQMARCVGAERAYLVLSDQSFRTHFWCHSGVAFPPGWPDRALRLAGRFGSLINGIVYIPDVVRLPRGEDREALLALGVRGWLCALRRCTDRKSIALGFDSVTHTSRTWADELGLMRMALDVISNALTRQSLEQERARLEARLTQAGQLERVGVFASGIAHNFNNIVGAILGCTEMAREHGAEDSQFSQIFAQIRQAGERARELVDQILMFAQRRDVNRSVVDIRTLITETITLLRASLPASVDLTLRQPSQSALVLGVSAQLQQVILNLCKNAAEAMDRVGRIELEVDLYDFATTQPLSHGVLPAGSYVRIAVSDSGRGIDETDLERIFEPFFTTRLNGHGLGLATTQEIVREHGGAINVQSKPAAGTRFEVWLPRHAPAASTSDEGGASLFGRGETVLVIETDPGRLLHDEEIVAALGYEPVGFTHAADAAAACRASPERFDIMVVGHSVPMRLGLEIAATLHNAAPGLPILLATTATRELGANALIVAGVSDIVPWPITAAGIVSSLRSCLHRRAPQ